MDENFRTNLKEIRPPEMDVIDNVLCSVMGFTIFDVEA
jgi:hypothetical protein